MGQRSTGFDDPKRVYLMDLARWMTDQMTKRGPDAEPVVYDHRKVRSMLVQMEVPLYAHSKAPGSKLYCLLEELREESPKLAEAFRPLPPAAAEA